MAKSTNYELFEELGRGENSVVYRAWDLALSRDVAIKEFVSEDNADGQKVDPQRINQFLGEAKFLAQFEHENVLRIHTVEQDRGWIVMELMKGSLASQIASEPMKPDTVRSVLRQMLGALDFLHQKEKVHGSVRPSNVLINEQGTVKLSDFEASSRDGELRAPQGSKKYLAPELIRSEFGDFGPAVDLYCLGFTALELLTGKNFDSLFPGTGEGAIDADVAWLRWHSSDEAMRPIKEIVPGVPDDLAGVIDQLLLKPVEQRPKDAAAVLKLLDDAPLVPVEVVQPVANPEKKSKAQPTPAVVTRKVQKKKVTRSAKEAPVSNKSRFNETLNKPYVLWPICVGILAAALFVGLQLRANKDDGKVADGEKPQPPVPVEKIKDSDAPVAKPVLPTRLAVEFRVLPDRDSAILKINGEERDFGDLELEPGLHDVLVRKDGFETFSSIIEIAEGKTNFDIVLKEIPITKPVMPKFIDVRVAVSPPGAEVLLAGKPVELNNGMLRLDPTEFEQLELAALAEGYQTRTKRWTLDDLERSSYEVKLALEKIPTPEPVPAFALPDSLIPKPGTEFDESTGLPVRAFARQLQDSSPLELALVTAGGYRVGVREGELRSWELSGKPFVVESPFYIGIDEVSVAQYSTFANREGGEQAANQSANGNDANLPVRNLSIRQAAQFCNWVGGRLPTEFEWEAAVRGQKDSGYPLPWNGSISQASWDAEKCKLFRGESDNESGPAIVGSHVAGANRIGLINTIGNVAEWCDNQHGTDKFIIKGCSYRIPPGNHVRVTWRNGVKWQGASDVGMRLMVPVADLQRTSEALTFAAPTNLDSLLVSADSGNQDTQIEKAVYTKTIDEIADEFTAPAELVIDSGGFIAEIGDVSFSPDGTQIAVGGGKVVRIWDVNSGKLIKTLRGDMSRTSYGNVNAVAWSPDGENLLVGVSDYREHGNIRVYSTGDMDEISEVLAGHNAPCRKLTFSRDGKYLTSVDADGLVLVRDWKSRKVQHRIEARDREKPIFDMLKFPGDEPYLLGVDFAGPQVISADSGKRLGSGDKMPARIRGWMVDVFNNLAKLPYGDKDQPRVMDFRMEEGRWAGAGSATVDGRSRFWIRIWESRDPVTSAAPAKELAAYDKHRWKVTAIALQPFGTLVASADKFGEVHVWDSQTGERKFKFAGQGNPVYEVAFDKSSPRLAFGTRPYTPKDWNRNSHGAADQVLDLRERAITGAASREGLELLNEQTVIGDASVRVRKKEANFFVERLLGNQVQSKYRISSGRNPSSYTLLGAPKLGVEQPVVFGDNEGLLALWDSGSDELKRAFIGHGNYVSAISAASHGKLIATSSTDRTIRLWSLEDHDPTGIFDFKFENSAVREIVPGTSSEKAGVRVGDRIVSIDGKSLTEMYEQMLLGTFPYEPGQAVPVEMKRGGEKYTYDITLAAGYDFSEPVLNFYMGDDGQWIIWHPQGYYDASPGADRLIGWHINRGYDKAAQFFEVQQFKQKLYRPDVIDGILEMGSLEGALKALATKKQDKGEEVDFRDTTVIAKHHPPSVRITYPDDNWSSKKEKVAVKGEANSVNGLPLTALTLLHNGSVAKVFRPTKVNQLSMEIEFEITLEQGDNDLVLIAANTKSSSQGEHIVVDYTSPERDKRYDAVVLSIGVSEFDDALAALPDAANDASAFAESMKSHANGRLYGNVKTKVLSQSVTNSEILDGFQWLADNTKEGNVAVVFIKSHGLVDRRDNFYIGSSNTRESRARSTAVSWRSLMDTLQLDLPDCKRMVFLDLAPTENSIKPGLPNPLLDLAAPEMGTIFLSSNTLQQQPVPLAGSDKGAFLSAVLETVGDRTADTTPASGDAMLNPVELAAGVVTRVKTLTKDKQHPVFFTPEFAKLGNVLELKN
jgi:serine/threonine protein kinase/WD40 repeat protein/formylglycine-generating enzyme required for sulfatase activity